MRKPGRQKLVGPVPVVILIAVALGGFWTLYREARTWRPAGGGSAGDPLAVAYLEAELKGEPGNAGTRLRLVRAQLSIGLLEEAERTFAPFLTSNLPLTAEQGALLLEISRASWRSAAPGSAVRAAAERRGLERVEALLRIDLPGDVLKSLAEAARELGHPEIAGRAMEKLARADPRSCPEALAAAARDHLAAGAPANAAECFVEAQACARDDRDALALGLQAVEAHLAAGQAPAALQVAEDLVRRLPADPDLLRRAEAIALGQGDGPSARSYGKKLLALGASDPELLQRQIDLGLAAGDPRGALEAAERLARLRPNDVESQLAAARVASWADRPGLALYYWLWLARRSKVPGASDQALQLARALGDDGAVVSIMDGKGREAPLGPDALLELEGALTNVEGSGRALEALTAHATLHPGNLAAWEQVAVTKERRLDLAGAVETRHEIARRFGATLPNSMRIATLEWTMGRPENALRELDGWTASAGKDAGYWAMVAELAWEIEADPQALQAYRKLWELGRADALGTERLVILTRATGQPDEVIRLGKEGWARTGQPRLLLLAMDEAANAGKWDTLRQLADKASSSEAAFSGHTAYWLLLARLDEHDGRTAGAVAAYQHALAIEPASTAARTGLIWLLAGAHDRKRLAEALAAWSDEGWNDPQMRRAYSAALEELGHPREALAFYQRDASANPSDDGAVWRYAMALDRSGDRRTSGDLQSYLEERRSSGPAKATPVEMPVTLASTAGRADAPSLEVVVRAEQEGFRVASMRAEVAVDGMGPLVVQRAAASIDTEAGGATFRIIGGGTMLDWSYPAQPVQPTQRGDVAARAIFRAFGGQNDLAAGGSFQAGSNLFMANASHEHVLAGTTTGRVDGFLYQPADESPALRLLAVRSGVGGVVAGSADAFYGRAGGSWKSWSTRTGGAVGTGVLASGEVGYRIPRTYPDLRVRAQGSVQWNWLAPDVMQQGFSTLGVAPDAILPAQLTMVGVGINAARFDAGPLRLSGDLWLGGMWPALRPAFRGQLGVAVTPYQDGEMSLIGFAGNDNLTTGGVFGLGITLTHGFAR